MKNRIAIRREASPVKRSETKFFVSFVSLVSSLLAGVGVTEDNEGGEQKVTKITKKKFSEEYCLSPVFGDSFHLGFLSCKSCSSCLNFFQFRSFISMVRA